MNIHATLLILIASMPQRTPGNNNDQVPLHQRFGHCFFVRFVVKQGSSVSTALALVQGRTLLFSAG
jgi:hypothetical protein